MKRHQRFGIGWLLGLWALAVSAPAQVVYETTSPYHHILVVDREGIRTLYFDNAMESRMSLADPLKGHFEYTEYFHMPWLWNTNLKSVLLVGLGGGSVPRSFQHYYPEVMVETIELDPRVVQVAKNYFKVEATPTHRITLGDGRVHLRRNPKKYDLIVMDAYTASRYGSFIPYSLATKEFFALASDRLTENGVLAYNVIGQMQATRANIVGTLYQTLNVVFPQVCLFPAVRSQNVVLIATKSSKPMDLDMLTQRANELLARKQITLPGFKTRLRNFHATLPTAGKAQVLTDDFAPVDGLLNVEP